MIEEEIWFFFCFFDSTNWAQHQCNNAIGFYLELNQSNPIIIWIRLDWIEFSTKNKKVNEKTHKIKTFEKMKNEKKIGKRN